MVDLPAIESLKSELQQLAATNKELLKSLQRRPELPPAKEKDFGSSGNILLPDATDELVKSKSLVEQLKKENEFLRRRVNELTARMNANAPTAWHDQQCEFERVLEEKTEAIRILHMQIQQLRGGPTGPSREELEHRQRDLDALEERLRGDEQSLNTQAREMEMAMAKDRAELARQRSEIQRMHGDLQRELELAGRDPALRERLASLQRRPDGRPKTANSLGSITLPALPQAGSRPATMAAIDLESDENIQHKPSLLRRIFGG